MAENSPLKKYADEQRPESLQKNLYKIDTPYDLNDDLVSKSLNLLRSLTGYDYRSNTLLNLVERLVDVENSQLLIEGGKRLAVEFGRRALTRNLGSLIPTPRDLTPNFRKYFKNQEYTRNDSFITDPEKNPKRTLADKLLENTIGYVDNDSYLSGLYEKYGGQISNSDINYKYSGDMIKEKILQLNKNSVFSTYNVKNTSKIEFGKQSFTFRNTYSEDFVNQDPENNSGLYTKSNNVDVLYTKGYFRDVSEFYLDKISSGKIQKDYEKEKESLEIEQGFGTTEPNSARETNTDSVSLKVSDSILNTVTTTLIGDDFRYDSRDNPSFIYLDENKVKRGLIYFTSKLAKENNIIAQDKKYIKSKDVNGNVINYYKGNGFCRTFTVYNQYDYYGRLIRFKGNGQANSVLKDSVMPKIAPMMGDTPADRRNYFFTMENLAVKVADTDTDCDRGPNGGRWMWFPPYNVKMSDNNSVNWSDMNFLGRPEPIFSYQNTTRNLSLSFTLLIDTVAKHQDVATTIQNHYDYLYGCKDFPDTNPNPPSPPPPPPSPPKQVPTGISKTEQVKAGCKYYFKNDNYGVKITDIDYTSGDTGNDLDVNGNPINIPDLNKKTANNLFISELNNSLTNLNGKITKDTNAIEITIIGAASELFSKRSSKSEKDYNLGLGMRRAYSLMKTIINEFNTNYGTGELGTINTNTQSPAVNETGGLYYFGEYETNSNEPKTKTFEYKNSKNNCTIKFTLKTEGSAKASDNPNFNNRNKTNFIFERYGSLNLIEVTTTEASQSTAPNLATPPSTNPAGQPGQQATSQAQPCDPSLTLDFQKVDERTRFPIGPERLKTFSPVFNSQTPFDFTKRYVFLHQLTRPSKLKNLTNIENTAFGRMPVFILRYGDFIHSKAIARSINFDIQESTWDLNPEGMGAIPLICNVTMDITLLGGQSLAGPIDKIQTANDSAFIANTSFNSGRYKDNYRFQSVRDIEKEIYGDIVNGSSSNNSTTSQANTNAAGGANQNTASQNVANGSNAPAGGNQSQAQNAAQSAAAAGSAAAPNAKPEERDNKVPKKDKDKTKTQQTTNKKKEDKSRKENKDNSTANPGSKSKDLKVNLNKSAIPGLTTEEINRVANLPAPSFNFNPNTSLQSDNTQVYRKTGGINKRGNFGGFGGGSFGGGGASGNF
jgi:hypothetical protein